MSIQLDRVVQRDGVEHGLQITAVDLLQDAQIERDPTETRTYTHKQML